MSSPSLNIRLLSPTDLGFAQEIRQRAGWNQTDKDWKRLLAHEPEGCFLAEWEGKPAGTATTTTHDGTVGWIGMVLVHPDSRRKGIATALLERCIEYLRPRTRCIKLDATPDGREVYRRLEFEEESTFQRWHRGRDGTPSPRPAEDSPPDLAHVLSSDVNAFGCDRSAYLLKLARDSRVFLGPTGFALLRPGENAHYLGPSVALDDREGESLVRKALELIGEEPVFWDIPDENRSAIALARTLGFAPQRILYRMRLGEHGFEGNLRLQWAIGAPETG